MHWNGNVKLTIFIPNNCAVSGHLYLRSKSFIFCWIKQISFTYFENSTMHILIVTFNMWTFNHAMMTSSNGNLFRVIGPLCGEFTGHCWIPLTKPVTRSFYVFFHLCLNQWLSKQQRDWWFETPSCSLWSHCNARLTLPIFDCWWVVLETIIFFWGQK